MTPPDDTEAPAGQAAKGPIGVDFELALEHPSLVELLGYWWEKCPPGALPSRDDIDPEQLVEHLRYLFMVDVEQAPFRFRYRLVGTALTTFLERDSTGKYLDEVYGPEGAAVVAERLRAPVAARAPVRISAPVQFARTDWRAFEGLLLPLADADGSINMILGELRIGMHD